MKNNRQRLRRGHPLGPARHSLGFRITRIVNKISNACYYVRYRQNKADAFEITASIVHRCAASFRFTPGTVSGWIVRCWLIGLKGRSGIRACRSF
jgi:hypothetical protein